MNRSVSGALTVGGWFTLLALSRPVAAHGDHGHGSTAVPAIPSVTFLVGVAVLAGSLYGDHRGHLDRRIADVGVVVGILAALTGITWFWI